MPIYQLPDEPRFPLPELAEPNGLLAVGGDLSPQRLLTAYSLGIFPWYSAEDPILWWSPDPRLVLRPTELHIGRSLRKTIAKEPFEIRCDTAFAHVISRCSMQPRPGQDGTWITTAMRDAYIDLHKLGFAHSIESFHDGVCVGGLYGISLGRAFFGESMFADQTDASKVAFVHLVETLKRWDFTLIDCQVETPHLARFGARLMPRSEFLSLLEAALHGPTRRGPWQLDPRATATG